MYIKHCKTSHSSPNFTLDLLWKNKRWIALLLQIKWKNTTLIYMRFKGQLPCQFKPKRKVDRSLFKFKMAWGSEVQYYAYLEKALINTEVFLKHVWSSVCLILITNTHICSFSYRHSASTILHTGSSKRE